MNWGKRAWLGLAGFFLLGVASSLARMEGPLITIEVAESSPEPPEPRCEELEHLLPKLNEQVELVFYHKGVPIKKVWATVVGVGLDYGEVADAPGHCVDVVFSYPKGGNYSDTGLTLTISSDDAVLWHILYRYPAGTGKRKGVTVMIHPLAGS